MTFQHRLPAAVFIGCLFLNSLWAGIVRGRVTDEAGKAVADAQVELQDTGSSRKIQLKTNKRGEFQASCTSAIYRVVVEKEGYRAISRQLTVGTLDNHMLRFKLQPGRRGVFAFEVSEEELADLKRKQAEQTARRGASLKATQLLTEGKQLVSSGKLAQAAVKLEQAAKVKPDGIQIWEQLGDVRLKLKQYDKAVAALQEAMSHHGEEKQMEQAALCRQIGDAYSAKGDSEKAQDSYARGHFLSGKSLLNEARNSQAAEEFRKVIELAPRHAEAHYQLGLALVGSPGASVVKEGLKYLKAYLKLERDGPNAEVAKSLIEQLK